jgi:ribosomal protein L32
MTAEEIVKELAGLIENSPEARIGHISLAPHILATADALTFCPKCGRGYKDSHYCLQCGHIKGKGGAY